ncbi:glycosyl transferase [Lacrimispora amygdalina]|uniref:Glycosyl transferase n=1 Tax=Lacrimispora amygdalina TaxID=253257 RepID=A0ABQ5M019_9FIRM|nr:glycosyltransferase family 4 protein [uncultured Clostridium sp.]
MRILIVNTFYYPNMQGGAEQSVKLLAEGLVKKGHEVGIYSVDSRDGHCETAIHNGVKIYRFTTNDFNLYRFSYDKKNVGKFEKIQQKLLCYCNVKCSKDFEFVCNEFKPDIVHTNTIYGMSYLIWKAAYKNKIPIVHTIRDIAIVSPVQYGHKANPLIRLIHRLYMRSFTEYVSCVTAPSRYTLETSLAAGCFKRAGVKKCIFNSVAINHSETEAIMKEKQDRTSPRIKFMYAGRLVYFKGIEHMIRAFESMQYKDCELYICGNGEMEEYVKKCAAQNPRIVFCGKLDNERLAEKYKESDILIVPSVWPEPFGRVLIEGNKYGLPVIAGRCGGMPEILENTHGGETYEAGDAGRLAELMDNLTERKRYKKYFNSILQTIDIYNIDRQIDKFEQVYNEILRR